jgi:heme/copper-type cytochrome/quinol oxidase subunit 3
MLAGLYYWFPKMSGRLLSERLGKVQFWLTVLGFNLTFFVQHFLGLMGMPRRVYTYPDLPAWGTLNLVSTIGAFILGFAMLLLAANIVLSLRRGRVAGDNPWDAWSLEWATSSPPPAFNFSAVPPISGRRPLWDLAQAKPDAPSVRSEPEVLPEKNKAAMSAFIASEAMFFLILILAFVYYTSASGPGPSSVSSLDVPRTAFFTACLLASSLTLWRAEKGYARRDRAALARWLIATVALGAAFVVGQAVEYWGLFKRGVVIDTNLFASTFFTLTGFHGLHVCVGLAGLSVLLWLIRQGDFKNFDAPAFGSLSLYWHFVDAVWVVVFSIVYLRPLL